MPQLNPAPWFPILLLVWTAIIIIFLNKTLHSNFLSTPALKETKQAPTQSWNWPWH